MRGYLVVSAVITAVTAVIPAVVPAAVLPGVRGRAISVPAAGSAAAAILSAVTLEAFAPLVPWCRPPSHFLPLLAAGGLPASAAAVAAVAAAVAGAPAAVAAAVPPTPAAGSLAAAFVACAPCSLPAWRRAATRGRWFVVGHFFHQVECCLGVNVFVWMDRVRRPAHADGLRHLLLAVAAPADQLKAVHHHSRCNCFPYLKFELCQVTQK